MRIFAMLDETLLVYWHDNPVRAFKLSEVSDDTNEAVQRCLSCKKQHGISVGELQNCNQQRMVRALEVIPRCFLCCSGDDLFQ